jgi:cytochrome o ubiquinol oxidase operon protein cyoD
MSNLKTYTIGFILSVLLTVAAFIPVVMHVNSKHQEFSHDSIIIYILLLALFQLGVQMFLFLHLGSGPKPRLNLVTFGITLTLVLIVIVASLWIMNHLNYNMSPEQINQYIIKTESF